MKVEKAIKSFHKINKIQGWFSFEAAMLNALLDEIQKENGITGDIFEIGVHHGRSTVFLAGMMVPEKEKYRVCDLFQTQDQNVSSSGKGNRKIFEDNMKRVYPNLNVEVFEKSSADLKVNEIGNKYRFFHIDGGHNHDEALPDIELASKTIIDKGIMIIDDPMTYVWPGVTHAIFDFLTHNEDFVAIVAGFNKLVLARKEYAHIYSEKLKDLKLLNDYKLGYPHRCKTLPFMNSELIILYLPSGTTLGSAKTAMLKFAYKNNLDKSPTLRRLVKSFKKS
ncbi:MAG: class I SAM-dependent methyltransferase [Bacteroidales bacterium]